MQLFREKVVLLTNVLNKLEGFKTIDPTSTFYVFPNVARSATSWQSRARVGAVPAGRGGRQIRGWPASAGNVSARQGGDSSVQLRRTERAMQQALDFIPTALSRIDRVAKYLESHPQFQLSKPYQLP